MKQLIFSLLAVAVTATTGVAQAQSPAPTKGHRVGLIDMAHVFQHYKKFEELRSGLQAEIEKSDAEAKVMVERLQKMQAEIKKFDAGSTEYEQREKQLLDLKGEFDAFRAATQRRLARRESETFKVIYTDVTKAVKLYAEYAHFDHVMRFNRKGIEEITNPQDHKDLPARSEEADKQPIPSSTTFRTSDPPIRAGMSCAHHDNCAARVQSVSDCYYIEFVVQLHEPAVRQATAKR
ncbi:MAG: OmpH family outer membrane protein [Fuerstiella sp.]|nr:OmpH family outer membrane protein [Fuerstiella sp.]